MAKSENFSLPGIGEEDQRSEKRIDFAKRVGLSPGRITQLVNNGMPTLPNGRIPIAEALAWMEANLDQTRRGGKPPPASVQDPAIAVPSGDAPSLVQIKTQHERAKLIALKQRIQKEAGQLVNREEVERAIAARAKAEREALVAWGLRASAVIAAEVGCDPGALHIVLDREIHEHLEAMSQMELLEGEFS
ncbi:hypothetical protein [Caenispirillum bisanense]|uniref:hypothetical protein n=1 Tax=Caenispirillum bisanense TaxID=414052 RepID=UPI0031CDB90B